ncbi:MAG: 4Fe-4S binding protein [Myxococcales bacterium]|nr:4Fe-4S binding protein [Myxococcales bacterium]
MGMFIRIDLNQGAIESAPGIAQKLVEICPVKIFKAAAGATAVAVVEDNVDECTLCDLCMQACPDGVKVVKLYEE